MSGGRKVPGYAGRKDDKVKKHEVWPGVLLDTSTVHVVHGVIKPLNAPAEKASK